MTVDAKTPTTAIIECVKEKYGQNIALRQAQKVKAILCPKAKSSCGHCGKSHASTAPCPRPRSQPTSHGGTSQTLIAGGTSGLDFTFTEDQPQDFNVHNNLPHTSGPALLSTLIPQTLPHPPLTLPPATHEIIPRNHPPPILTDPHLPGEPRPHSTGPNSHRIPSQPLINNPSQLSSQLPSQLSTTSPSQPPSTTTSTLPTHRPTAPPPQQPARTPQETRLEAARLMQNAARLMQEAARMNAEAARLTASVASF